MITAKSDSENQLKTSTMRFVLGMGVVLTLAKFVAYWLTHSNAILSDALESIINIIAAAFGLYSLSYASKPKDEDHPYGHGKMEFLAVGFEGGLIFFTGVGMIFKAIFSAFHPLPLQKLDIGLWITAITSVINLFLGRYLLVKGKQLDSSTLIADGKHLLADTWSAVMIITGLLLMIWTGLLWIDILLTIIMGGYILIVGYKLVKDSLSGLMDEADFVKLDEIVVVLNKSRQDHWIDIHNLRVVKYGSHIHIDAHLTLPWYEDLEKSHRSVKELEVIVNSHFGNKVEFFIHTDPCLPTSCSICAIGECPVRKEQFASKLHWDLPLLLKNKPHTIEVKR
jgi:cation diffusion facilitator family transporter